MSKRSSGLIPTGVNKPNNRAPILEWRRRVRFITGRAAFSWAPADATYKLLGVGARVTHSEPQFPFPPNVCHCWSR